MSYCEGFPDFLVLMVDSVFYCEQIGMDILDGARPELTASWATLCQRIFWPTFVSAGFISNSKYLTSISLVSFLLRTLPTCHHIDQTANLGGQEFGVVIGLS